jgi:hypothetical protein
MNYWRNESRKAIDQALRKARVVDINGKLLVNRKDLLRIIREAYPFGERKRHPYKMWLKEVKVTLFQYSLLKHNPDRYRSPRPIATRET